MMNKVLFCVILMFSFSLFSQDIFHTSNGRIIDPEGNDFIAHGTNACGPRYWKSSETVSDLAYLLSDVWGFNAVRLNWRRWEDAGAHETNSPIEAYIKHYVVEKGMVVMIELHDWTGKDNVSGDFTTQVKEHWVEMANKFGTHLYDNTASDPAGNGFAMTKSQASRVWFNLRNEPISSNNSTVMLSLKEHYDTIIAAVRATGAQNMVVLDGSTWANEYNSTTFNKTYGPYYRDNFDNIVMSIHYGKSSWGKSEWANYFKYFTSRNIPLVVGEISQAAPSKTVENTRAVYGDPGANWFAGEFDWNGAAYEARIGTFYWHFHGGDSGDLTTSGGGWKITGYEDGQPNNLSEEGKMIWGDIRRARNETTIAPAPKSSLLNFELRQNYPNPFNPVTEIVYTLPQRTSVDLKVYDLNGRTVALLVQEVQNPGSFRIKFDGSGLPSGIYFYVLNAGDVIRTRKMMLIG